MVLTGLLQFIMIPNILEPRPKVLPDLNLIEAPSCWDVLPSEFSLSKHLEVFVAVKQSIFVVDQANFQDQVKNHLNILTLFS